MECPNCGLINPESGQRCDYGYDFVAKTRPVPARALEPQLHLGWGLAVLGLSVVAMICVIIAHQPEGVGVLIWLAIVVVGSSLIARRLEAKRRQAVPHKRLAYLAAVLHGDSRGPQNAATDLAVAALLIPTHYYVIRRKKWAWVMGTVISLNPVVWITNVIYGRRRWKEFTG